MDRSTRANVIIVTLRFVKLNYYYYFFHVGFLLFSDPQQNIALRYAIISSWVCQNQTTWEIINFGTAAFARYNNYAACPSRHKIEPRTALCARLLRGAWNAPSTRKRRALAFYLLAIFHSNCILYFLLQMERLKITTVIFSKNTFYFFYRKS